MSSTVLARYAKSVCGAIVAGAGAAATAAADGHISLAEGCIIVVAFFGTLGGVAAVPNAAKDEPLAVAADPGIVWPPTVAPTEGIASRVAPAIIWPPLVPADETAAVVTDLSHAGYLNAPGRPNEQQPARRSHIRRPLAITASLDAQKVATAYNYPATTGKGFTGGIIELGGGFSQSDLETYFGQRGLPTPSVVAVPVAGGKNKSDGPDGADGEVLLDIEVAAAVAVDAKFRVYFAPNTDSGFLAAIKQAVHECDAVSISWGGPENSWDPATMDAFEAVFAAARQAGVPVFVAAGDTGSSDSGGRGNHVDFPASSPSVIGCGGTRLTVKADGSRDTEVVWDDNDRTSATGGGTSAHFLGRNVPDVAGNADPATGYDVLVDGEEFVIGGTSAVAPLYLGLHLAILEAVGGRRYDFLNTVVTNPGICFDVTSGDNGAFRAGPGRDQTTGFGVVDGGKLLEVLGDAVPDPVPPSPPAPTPTGTYTITLPGDVDAKVVTRSADHRGGAETPEAYIVHAVSMYVK